MKGRSRWRKSRGEATTVARDFGVGRGSAYWVKIYAWGGAPQGDEVMNTVQGLVGEATALLGTTLCDGGGPEGKVELDERRRILYAPDFPVSWLQPRWCRWI